MRTKPRLFQLLTRAQRLVAEAAERESTAALGVTPVQLGLLYALEGDGPHKMVDVGRALDLSPAALSGLVDRSERIGIVARQPSVTDGRSVHLVTTAHGRSVRERSYPLLAQLNARLVEDLSEAEQMSAVKFLNGLIARFGNRTSIRNGENDE